MSHNVIFRDYFIIQTFMLNRLQIITTFTLIALSIFSFTLQPLKTEANQIIPEQIQLEYMNTTSKQIIQSGLELELKNMLIKKDHRRESK